MKIDPKSIGVGQYQHDVSQTQLARKLDAVVEDCVNAVGVDLNTASVPLLTRVAGLTRMMAQNIVAGATRMVSSEPPAAAESQPSGAESL